MLGAGIYALVGKVAGEVGGAIWIPLALALFLAMLTAGSYAELVTKYPKAGGAAVFAERAFKVPLISFLVGFGGMNFKQLPFDNPVAFGILMALIVLVPISMIVWFWRSNWV